MDYLCDNCRVHAGFYLAYESVEKQIHQHIESILKKHPSATMVATGHSLGAAISALCAISIKILFANMRVQLHNYGQPRAGNKQFADFMAKKLDGGIYRVVHNKDAVPHLPPDLPEFNYHHSAYEVFFNEDLSVYKVCN